MQANVELILSHPVTPSIHFVRAQRPPEFRFQAGQYAMVEIETSAGPADRFLSIASAPSDPHLDFAVHLSDSEFKRAFSALEAGDRLRLIGPSGGFVRDPERPAVLLSGGVGITPLRSMLRDAVHRGDLPPTILVFGNRSPREVPFHDELDAMAGHADVRVLFTVDEAGAEWSGAVGRIGRDLVDEARRDLADTPRYYVCGPPGMVEAMSGLLAELEIDANDITREHFTGY